MTSLTIRLPLPPKELSPNAGDKIHWGKIYRLKQQYREDAINSACVATQQDGRPYWKHCRAKAVFYFPDRRRRDIGNFDAMLKPAWDGFRAYGIYIDDNEGVLKHDPTEFVYSDPDPRVEITIREEPAGLE